MIRFGRITARDFGPLGDVSLDLGGRGLLLIRGDNRDTSAAESNGSGKTTIFKAVTWALFGKTVDGDQHDAVVRAGTRGCEVKVDWQDEAGWWSVVRAKARGSAAELRLLHGSEDLSDLDSRVTQAKIVERLGLDFETWRSTVLYGQGDLVRFADPATTDGERKAILKRILRLEVLDSALDLARKRLEKVEKSRASHERAAETAEAELRGVGTTDSLRAAVAEAEVDLAAAEKKLARLDRLRALLAQVDDLLSGAGRTREAIQERQRARRDLESERATTASEAILLEREADRLAREADDLAAGACPTCGAPAASAHLKKRVREKRKAAETTRIESEIRKDRVGALNGKIHASQLEVSRLEEELREGSELEAKRADLRAEVRAAESALGEAERARRRLRAATDQLAALEGRRARLEAEILEERTIRDQLDDQARHLQFWARGLSNAGLPSYLMDAVVPELTERANYYLGILSDGDIRVDFDTQTTLKKGEAREKIAIRWDIEGVAGATPSGGQRRKISVAVDLALMDLVTARERAGVDLLMMDEVLDGLDAAGKARVMDLLGELRQRRSSILVVSHDAGLQEMFESVVTVVKEGGVSRLEALS